MKIIIKGITVRGQKQMIKFRIFDYLLITILKLLINTKQIKLIYNKNKFIEVKFNRKYKLDDIIIKGTHI